jgi:hypothetical protein
MFNIFYKTLIINDKKLKLTYGILAIQVSIYINKPIIRPVKRIIKLIIC